ncbi:S8 family serine peptidase [Barnesiella intestinihominis]|uniref:S8 family serine peptidase n=2 Tax=Barnesiella intestinihominis TaxID=487174 RepID=UPI003991984F
MIMRKKITCMVAAALAFMASAQPFQSVYYPSKLTASTITRVHQRASALRSADENIHAIVRLCDEADLDRLAADYGVAFNVVTGNLATAVIPMRSLVAFAEDADVENVDAGNTVRAMTDLAREYSQVDALHGGLPDFPRSFTGKGVLIGVIDTGFDFMHPAFRDAEGNSRIIHVWDQSGRNGNTPSMGYGVVFDTPELIRSAAHDVSRDTHGTHVAAIAASSADVYKGMAPESDIVIVATDKSESGIIDALAYLLDYAEKEKKPMAINLSMGTVIGFKDGTDPIASMIDELLDKSGKKCLMAIAAGNEGHRNSTIVTEATGQGEVINTSFTPPSHMRENIFIGCSTTSAFQVTLSLVGSDGVAFETSISSDVSESVSHENITGEKDYSLVTLSPMKDADGLQRGVSINLYAPLKDGQKWKLSVTGAAGKYIACCDYGELDNGSNASTMAATACGQIPISVGAYVSRDKFTNLQGTERSSDWTVGERYPLSGMGPAFDGRDKPDVLAPGAHIISAINNYAASYNVNREDLAYTEVDALIPGRTNYWGAMCGTSMATPVVTGIMALWLQANPRLDFDLVRKLIGSPGSHIDAKTGMESLLAGVELPKSKNTVPYIYNPFTRSIAIIGEGVVCVEVFAVDGTVLKRKNRPVEPVHIPEGAMRIVRITTSTGSHILKI